MKAVEKRLDVLERQVQELSEKMNVNQLSAAVENRILESLASAFGGTLRRHQGQAQEERLNIIGPKKEYAMRGSAESQ